VTAAAWVLAAVCTATGGRPRVLLFSKTAGFRHDSIPAAVEALRDEGGRAGFDVRATEDAAVFTDAGLTAVDVVVFLSTTGDVLDDDQQAAFERFIRAGGGFVGVHAAADTEYDWPWYGRLVGAYFAGHPAVQPARVVVADRGHPSTSMLPLHWTRTDEWYSYKVNPRGTVHVLATVAKAGYRIYEVGVSYAGRTYAEGKKIGWRDGVRALWCIVKYNTRR